MHAELAHLRFQPLVLHEQGLTPSGQSIDELGNGGRSTADATRAARILPAARESGTSSTGRARARARTAASASATGSSELTIARYTRVEAGTLAA